MKGTNVSEKNRITTRTFVFSVMYKTLVGYKRL